MSLVDLTSVSNAKVTNTTNFITEDNKELKRIAKDDVLNLNNIKVTDTEGILGSEGETVISQLLIDKIADKVVNQLVSNDALNTKLLNYILKTNIDNNLTGTDPTHVLASPQGAQLSKQIEQLNYNISNRDILGDFDLELTKNSQTISLPDFNEYSQIIWTFKEENNNVTYFAVMDRCIFNNLTNISYLFSFRGEQLFTINIIPPRHEIRMYGDFTITVKLKTVYGIK